MLLGTYAHALDGKGRLAVPAKFRPDLGEGVVLTRGIERCIFAFGLLQWQALYNKLVNLPLTSSDSRDAARLFLSQATHCELDRQGRILIPGFLREYANLDSEVIVVGVGSRVEIWNPARWREVTTRVEEDAELGTRLASLGI